MASNPIAPAEESTNVRLVPKITDAPPKPDKIPATTITHTYVVLTLIPAVRAACGFAPTALNLNPRVDRSINHHTPAAATRAKINPKCKREGSGNSRGNIALDASGGVIG